MDIPSNKLAMSKALGAAFLKHQVEQMEKAVYPKPSPRSTRRPTRRASSQADVVVVDASVLIHGLHHVERWSKPDHRETVVIPLEVLTTLDMLKRTSKHARAASRLLENQIGYNHRFRIQLDHNATPPVNSSLEPQWIKNTLHCARLEMDAAPRRKVVLAICPSPTTHDRAAGTLVLDSARLVDIPVLVLAASGQKRHPKRYEHNASDKSSSDELDADVLDFEDLMRVKRLTSSPTRTNSTESLPTRRLWTASDSDDSSSRPRESICDRRQDNVQAKVRNTKDEWPALPGAPSSTVVHRMPQASPRHAWKINNVIAVY